MNNTNLKKWSVLALLLLVTLVLVWNAPEPEQTEVVEAINTTNKSQLPSLGRTEPITPVESLALKPRQRSGDIVDLFASPKKKLPPPPKKVAPPPVVKEVRWELPFNYIGQLKDNGRTQFFLMEGTALYLVEPGDVINEQYRLKQVDDANQLLVWQHLPSNETRNMSTEK